MQKNIYVSYDNDGFSDESDVLEVGQGCPVFQYREARV